ncbi:MAG: glycoside hydrolase family 3 C-terminal domain-containing protein [Erysipelotrichaceae bacterium]|nr:glycoside hydrolase family 3 C-terminal domain-containing protein [Erysipelotrichaceae bacterium]
MKERIEKLIQEMTLEEKAGMCSGFDFWHIQGVERLGIPNVMITDGPHGLRKQAGAADHLGLNASVPATCFPPAVTTASSWDTEAIRRQGSAIAEECIQEEVAVVLGPGTNIKRSPLCGRNFEYFSEDPLLAGEMAAAIISGIQEKGVGTSLKHFAANNQEKARLTSNSVIDERALCEIYLKPFEIAVRKSQPWTLMCSYNRINDVYSCENDWLLNQKLRQDWGFKGIVMTDWGAMNERVKALKAGLELEMPGKNSYNDQLIVDAVKNGELDPAVLDGAVSRLLEIILRFEEVEKTSYDAAAHHALAREIAGGSLVLLKNEGALPLDSAKKYAVVGAFANKPRYQGAGSSKINSHKVDEPFAELQALGIDAVYAPGYSLENDEVDEALLQEAVECAKKQDAVIVFAGLPDAYESEGFDRTHMNMPASHNALIEAVAEVNPNVTVVLMCGSAVTMPWLDKVSAVLLAYLGGEAAGGAVADVLTGKVNPSGKLAETFPVCLEDNPSYGFFATEDPDVQYRESILVGYRFYDWADKEVVFPFGYGLSYTKFAYEGLEVSWDDETGKGEARVTVRNCGERDGREVVELYVAKNGSAVLRPVRELKGFVKVALAAGETKTVTIPLCRCKLAAYDRFSHSWKVEDGSYTVFAGPNSRELPLSAEICVKGETLSPDYVYTKDEELRDGRLAVSLDAFAKLFDGEIPLHKDDGRPSVNMSVRQALNNDKVRPLVEPFAAAYKSSYEGRTDDIAVMMLAMFYDMPLRSLSLFTGKHGYFEEAIAKINSGEE